MTAPTPREVLPPEEAARRAVIYVLQLADKDIGPLLGESIVAALAQDGYALTRHEPLDVRAALREKYWNVIPASEFEQLVDAFEAAIRAEYPPSDALRAHWGEGYRQGTKDAEAKLAALREAAQMVDDAFGAMFVGGAYQATQQRIDALNRMQDALAATPAEEDADRGPIDVERLAHKAAEIGFTYGALGRDFEYAYKNVNDMLRAEYDRLEAADKT